MPPHGTILNFFPDADELSEAFAEVLSDYTWKSYTIIYENKDNLMRLKDVLQVHTRRSKDVKLRQLDDNYGALLKEIHKRNEKNIVLDISVEKIVPFLREADRLKMLDDYNRYLVLNLDTHTLNFGKLENTTANITCLRLVNPASDNLQSALRYWKQQDPRMNLEPDHIPVEAALVHDGIQIFWDAFQIHASRFFKLIKNIHNCNEPKRDRKDPAVQRTTNVMQIAKYMDYDGATGRILFNNETGRRNQFLLEILEFSKGEFTRIGHWTAADKVKYDRDEKEVDAQIVEAIQNKVFKIASKLNKPFFMEVKPENGTVLEGNERYKGYVVDLIKELQKVLNFKYELEAVAEMGSFDDKTNQWNGIVRKLLDNKADLGIADMSITYERKKVIDFTAPFMNLGIGILFHKPEQKEKSLFSFLDPFDTIVWMCTGFSFLTISFLLFIVSRINSDDWEPTHPW